MIRRTLLALACLLPFSAVAQDRFITLASTTSTEQSGLLGHLIPLFRQQTGINVRVVAVGTGQALEIGMRGDADALLVYDRAGEARFVAEGHGRDRRDVMFNDFVVVGPKTDPANIRDLRDAPEAFRRIAQAKASFVSRSADSGNHRKELWLWKLAGLERPTGEWYRESGQGARSTLSLAAGLNGYTLTDRASWASFKNRGDLEVLAEREPALVNLYGSILVNPAKGAHIKAADAKTWHEWLTSEAGRKAIASFKVGGEQIFFPAGTGPRSQHSSSCYALRRTFFADQC
jgi:tungstate transport system substrate-binding protein